MRKSGAAVCIFGEAFGTTSEYTSPVGLLYFGTHQMPLIVGSDAASRSTASMSGPSPVSGTGSMSMPKASQMVK